jgi:hypothetical protein
VSFAFQEAQRHPLGFLAGYSTLLIAGSGAFQLGTLAQRQWIYKVRQVDEQRL